jgi:hypothetical protein
VHNARLTAHTQFVQQALGAAGQSVDSLRPAVTRYQECLPRLWRIPWDNRCKEALRRLAVNGLPGCTVARAVPCLCALHCGSETQQTFAHRQHAFWDCLLDAEVLRQLALALPIGFQLSQHHLWLVEAPPGILQKSGIQLLWLLCMPWSLGESTCGLVLLRALRVPRYVCKQGAHGPSLCSGLVFTFSLLCIDTCCVRAGMLWVPHILFILSPASPHAYLFGYFPLTMLLLRALSACIFFSALDSFGL